MLHRGVYIGLATQVIHDIKQIAVSLSIFQPQSPTNTLANPNRRLGRHSEDNVRDRWHIDTSAE
jgi:hypothetical protein